MDINIHSDVANANLDEMKEFMPLVGGSAHLCCQPESAPPFMFIPGLPSPC